MSLPASCADMAGTRSVGILYEIWHTAAAAAMAQVAARNLTQLTVESVIRSANESCLDDVYPAHRGPWYSDDIFNVKPKDLGFYCLYRARSESCRRQRRRSRRLRAPRPSRTPTRSSSSYRTWQRRGPILFGTGLCGNYTSALHYASTVRSTHLQY